MMDDEFEPVVEHVATGGGITEPRIRWGSGYKVLQLARPSSPSVALPGHEVLLNKEMISETENALVLGEGSGGVRDLLEWWAMNLSGQPSRPWIVAHGSSWSAPFLRYSLQQPTRAPSTPRGSKPAPRRANEMVELVAELPRLDSSEAIAQRVIELDDRMAEPFWLIIRNAEALGRDPARRLAEAFVLVRDPQRCPNLRLVVGSSSDEIFLEERWWSTFQRFLWIFRTAAFRVAEVATLAAAWRTDPRDPGPALEGGLDLPHQVAEKVVELTGGQPLLVQTMLGMLASRMPGRGRASRKAAERLDVEEAFEELRRAPPAAARTWQRDLERIFSKDPGLVETLRAYTSGYTKGPAKFPPDARERPLYIGGWVRLNSKGRWGIASPLHTELAGPVLDKVEGRK